MAKTTKHYDLMVEVLGNNWPSKMTGVPPTDSDKELLIQMLQISGADFNAEQMGVIRQFNFESITRARRKLQRSGQFLPISDAVAKLRRLKSYEIQQVAPKESAGGLQRRIEQNVI